MYRIVVNLQTGEQESIPLTAEEIAEIEARPQPIPGPDYLAFWDALMMSTVYASIREQSFTSLPMNTLATEFIALMGDAKAGRPSEPAIQASINAILAIGTFTEAHLTELQAALEAGHLETIYVLPTPTPTPPPEPEPTPSEG